MATKGQASRRRPRASLDRELILTTALQLVAEGSPLTVRALGNALEADPTSIYRHVRDRDELVRTLWDHLLRELLAGVGEDLEWREQLRAIARGTLDLCVRYPAIGREVGAITTGDAGELATVERLLELFVQAGLEPRDALRYYAVYASYVLSFSASVAAALADAEPDTNDGQSWIGELGPVDPRHFPVIFGVRDELSALQDDEIFMDGVDLILDAAAAASANKSAT